MKSSQKSILGKPVDFLYSFFKFIVAGTEALLFLGISPIVNTTIIPAIPMIIGMGTLSGKRRLLGIFLGFILSFAISQIALSYVMNVFGIDYPTLQKMGLPFLILFGLMMLYPRYAIWNRSKDDYRKAKYYGIIFGFIWSFWAAVPNTAFGSEYNIIVIFILFYFMLVAASVPALFFILIAFVLSKLYSEKYLPSIKKGIGWLTLLISLFLLLGVVKTSPNVLVIEQKHN